jgi:hypothetical protein
MDIKIFFALASLALIISAMIPYIYGMFKQTNKPHLYTWLIWSITGCIATAAYIHGNGGYPAVTSGIGTALCILVFVLSFKYGTRNITVSDTVCLIIAAAAIFAWVVLNNPLASVILGISVDLIGYYPTFRKSYAEPWSESRMSWILWTVVPLFSILALSSYNVFTLINATPIFVINTVFLIFMHVRRGVVPKPADIPKHQSL